MIIESLQGFIETFCPNACVPVDLVKIARNLQPPNVGRAIEYEYYKSPGILPSPLCLVMDGECCLDRLYGGYFGDWVCGGQWNRMADFLRSFFEVVNRSNIKITVVFNGAPEHHKMSYWVEKQKSVKEKISQVLRHTSYKGTPPPKVWWIAPNGLRTCLRLLLRHLKVNVVLTTTDHHQEVMSYLKRFNYHGLLADDPEYLVLDPPRYFSSTNLKLTFKGCLETKECILNEVTRSLNLQPGRICIVAALLGNHILTDLDLALFHQSLCSAIEGKVTPNILIQSVVDYVRNLQSVDDLNAVAWKVFGINSGEKCEKFKQSVLYYRQDNKNKESHISNTFVRSLSFLSQVFNEQSNTTTKSNKIMSSLLHSPASNDNLNWNHNYHKMNSHLPDSNTDALQMKAGEVSTRQSKFASETDESEKSSLKSFHQVVEKAKHGAFYQQLSVRDANSDTDVTTHFYLSGSADSISNRKEGFQGKSMDISRLESSIDSLSLKQSSDKLNNCTNYQVSLPEVSSEVLCMSRARHQKGQMHPYIFQILTQGEIKIPVTFEDDSWGELPSPAILFRPLRQMLYALLFNQHHLQCVSALKKENEGIEDQVPKIVIKEWVWSQSNMYIKPDYVPSVPLGCPVPTVHCLWFSTGPESNKTRLQAFFTCMQSNNLLMCDPMYVPQHLIILCCVLRYMLCSPETPFLYKYELDAFLVQAVDPHLMDTEYTQKLEVPLITQRGVLLAAIFMNGVDHALMANDACGAPISWLMCCPWLFFDGKIFHRKLLKASSSKNLADLCDNRFEEVSLVEQMRNAIFDGIKPRFLPPQQPSFQSPPNLPNYPAAVQSLPLGRGRGHQRVVPRGGQLEVAGVVVGSWGPNYGQGPRSPNRSVPPQIVSVGGVGRGRGGTKNVPRKDFGVGRANSLKKCSTTARAKDSSMKATPRLGMGRGALPIESAKSQFYDLGFEI